MDVLEVGPARVAWSASGPDRDRSREFAQGRSLVTDLVAELFPTTSGWTVGSRACPRCGEPHGGVELTGVAAVAGVSYARGLVVAVAARSDAVSRLGVDVERDAVDVTRTRDLERLLGPSRQPVLRRWTRIEAVLKADGRGLLVEPSHVRFAGNTASIAGGSTGFCVADVVGPAGYLISLAWCGAESSAASSGPATA